MRHVGDFGPKYNWPFLGKFLRPGMVVSFSFHRRKVYFECQGRTEFLVPGLKEIVGSSELEMRGKLYDRMSRSASRLTSQNVSGLYTLPIYDFYLRATHARALLPAALARTRTRTNTNPNDTEANAAGRSARACVARKSKS